MPTDLDAYWMPFTSNRQFKKAPRLFTRAGSFTVDNSGFLKNAAGLYLQGWVADILPGLQVEGTLSACLPFALLTVGCSPPMRLLLLHTRLRRDEHARISDSCALRDVCHGPVANTLDIHKWR